jgi:hypothetical protein
LKYLDFGRSKGDSSVFVLDAETSECLHYEPVMGYPPTTLTRIPREILVSHPEIEIRNDLIDCSIDVCSVEVSLSQVMKHKIILICAIGPFVVPGQF